MLLSGISGIYSTVSAAEPVGAVDNNKEYYVTIYEVTKTHVPLAKFSGKYKTEVKTADGKNRTIEITPVVHKGKRVMQVTDNNHTTYMALDGDTLNGQIHIQTRDKEALENKMKSEGW